MTTDANRIGTATACRNYRGASVAISSQQGAKRWDWLALIGNMNGAVRDLRQAAPEIMKTFSDMTRAVHGGEALDGKTKELVALAIAVATRCAPCIPYHAEGGRAPRARQWPRPWRWRMGAGPSVMYAAQALEAVDQIAAKAARPA